MVYFWKEKNKVWYFIQTQNIFVYLFSEVKKFFGAPGWDEAWAPFKYKLK